VLTVPADVAAEQTSADGTPVDIGQATAIDTCDADVVITNDRRTTPATASPRRSR